MKRRLIRWGFLILAVLVLARGHLIIHPLRPADAVIEVKTTGYCMCRKCCSWEFNWLGMPVFSSGSRRGRLKTIGQTASGRMVRPGTVAVDPKVFPIGTKFYIPGYGWGIARDTGGDIKGRHLDLFFWLHKTGDNWGVQYKKVHVWYPQD
jgi:3D (Asp-Asp-Asp) domain-containing protein